MCPQGPEIVHQRMSSVCWRTRMADDGRNATTAPLLLRFAKESFKS